MGARVDSETQILPEKISEKIYVNPQYSYSITLPSHYRVDGSIPELVAIEGAGGRVRVNAGCYEFGTEHLTSTFEPITINGLAAMKESYYLGSQLKLRKFSLSVNDKCFSMEVMAENEALMKELEGIVRTFNLTP